MLPGRLSHGCSASILPLHCTQHGIISGSLVSLTGQPQDYESQTRSRSVLLSLSNPRSVVLRCDVTPGQLRSLYSLRWFRLFTSASGESGFQRQPDNLVDLDTFDLRLNSSKLLQRRESVTTYQCRVTVKHDPSSANQRDYYGRMIKLHTMGEVACACAHVCVCACVFLWCVCFCGVFVSLVN